MDLTGNNLGVYHLEALIDRGPRATVYRARQTQVGRVVALKLYHESVDPGVVRRTYEATEQLTYAHVLPMYHFDIHAGQALVAMRYMPVGSLAGRRRGAMTQKDIAHILPQIAQALDHAHAHGVLHLNLKPANILFDHPGNAFVTDFGLPAEIDSPYTAPELARGGQVDARADVYGLGALLYLMLSGRAPLARRVSNEIAENQRLVELPAPRSIRPEISLEVEEVVMRALSIDPDARYATPGELVEAYLEVAAQDEGESERAPLVPMMGLPLRRMVLGALGIIAVGVIAWVVASSAPGTAVVEPTASVTASPTASIATEAPSSTLPVLSDTSTATNTARPSATHTSTRPTTITLAATPTLAAASVVETLSARTAPAAFTPAPIVPTATATFTVVKFELKSPPVRLDVGDRLELFFDMEIAPAQGGPYGQLFAFLPEIDSLVTERLGAQVSSGTQVLRLVIGVDCARLPEPVTTDRIILEIRENDRSPTLFATSIPYVQIWCR